MLHENHIECLNIEIRDYPQSNQMKLPILVESIIVELAHLYRKKIEGILYNCFIMKFLKSKFKMKFTFTVDDVKIYIY